MFSDKVPQTLTFDLICPPCVKTIKVSSSKHFQWPVALLSLVPSFSYVQFRVRAEEEVFIVTLTTDSKISSSSAMQVWVCNDIQSSTKLIIHLKNKKSCLQFSNFSSVFVHNPSAPVREEKTKKPHSKNIFRSARSHLSGKTDSPL